MSQIARSPMQVGAIIRTERQKKGLSQGALAELGGMHQPMISIIEKGHEGVKLSSICDLLAALDLELAIQPRSKSTSDDVADLF